MKLLRKVLFPFSLLYGAIVILRNKMFDKNLLSATSYDFPIICVGNLNTGGTGKSPMVEYLVDLLKEKHEIATLSRGYGRKTSGFHLLTGKEPTTAVGDEPLQFKNKFPELLVAVDEERQHGIFQLRSLVPKPEVILLDDAFQHRKVTAGLSILLTAYDDLYTNDFLLPSGNLREPKSGASRADIIVVTKCPATLPLEKRAEIQKKLKPKKGQGLYFSTIVYDDKVRNGRTSKKLSELDRFALVTGIENPGPLREFLHEKKLDFQHLAFPDHHEFSPSELKKFGEFKLVITTEKDFMRLRNELPKEKLFYLPIRTKILDHEKKFENEILEFIDFKQ